MSEGVDEGPQLAVLDPGGKVAASAEVLRPDPAERTLEHGHGSIRHDSFLRSFSHSVLGMIGLAIFIVIILFSFVGPLLYHSDQLQANISLTNLGPARGRPLGTDANGFDILGRLMVGGQVSVEVGVAVALMATTFGALWGGISGFTGGVLDAVLMRIVDVFISVPAIFVLIFLATVFRPSLVVIMLALSFLAWLTPARLVRGETLSLRTREFVDAARIVGRPRRGIVARHIVPNTFGTIAVNATFQVADAIINLAALSFLGFGPPPPVVTWGGMLSQGTTYLLDGYWWEVYPVLLLLTITVLSINFLGDALAETLDARLRSK